MIERQLPGWGAVPQIIGVKERAVNSHVVSDPVDSTFDVLPPGVHRQQRVACTDWLTVTAGDTPVGVWVTHYNTQYTTSNLTPRPNRECCHLGNWSYNHQPYVVEGSQRQLQLHSKSLPNNIRNRALSGQKKRKMCRDDHVQKYMVIYLIVTCSYPTNNYVVIYVIVTRSYPTNNYI